MIATWPGVIVPNSVNYDVISLLDLLPTMCSLVNGSLPNVHIDGVSFAHILLAGSKSESVHRFIPFFCDRHLMAVRYGPFKLYLRTNKLATEENIRHKTYNGLPLSDWYKNPTCEETSIQDPPILYNIEHDPGERFPLYLDNYVGMTESIMLEIVQYLETMKDDVQPLLDRKNANRHVRPCCNPPFCICVANLLSKSVCPVKI